MLSWTTTRAVQVWVFLVVSILTSPDDAVAKSSVNGLVGIGFTSQYRLQPKAVFFKAQWVGVKPLHHLLSHNF